VSGSAVRRSLSLREFGRDYGITRCAYGVPPGVCLWCSGWLVDSEGVVRLRRLSLALLSTGLLVAAPASAPAALPAGPISSLSVASAVTLKSGVTLTHHYRPVNRVSRAGNRGIVIAGSPAWAEPLERPGQVGASLGRSSQGLARAASWGAAYVVRRTLGACLR